VGGTCGIQEIKKEPPGLLTQSTGAGLGLARLGDSTMSNRSISKGQDEINRPGWGPWRPGWWLEKAWKLKRELKESSEGSTSNHLPSLPDPTGSPLVNRFISSRKPSKIEVYPSSCKVVREFSGIVHKPGIRGKIDSFSQSSKRRLKLTAVDASPILISQFCLTYHEKRPSGRETKHHVNMWLKRLNRAFPEICYLWILEFQERGVPHFHIFLSYPRDTPGLQEMMAEAWHEIADSDSEEHLCFHLHPKNFIAWEMGMGGYVCKYLDKEHQKRIPEGFEGVGRFWGCSRGLRRVERVVNLEELDEKFTREIVDEETGEIGGFRASEFVVRQIGKAHEKRLKRWRFKSRARTTPTSYTTLTGGKTFKTLEKWMEKEPPF
jgi:hypothetical protein